MYQYLFTGVLIDLASGRKQPVNCGFHLKEPWWQIIILRTRKNKEKQMDAKDPMALCYRLRDDPMTMNDRVVHLLLSKISDTVNTLNPQEANWFGAELELFYQYLR